MARAPRWRFLFPKHYSMRPGDPWVGPNSGANLTDSEMSGRIALRFAGAAADRWMRVVLSPNALGARTHQYHMYAAHALSEELGPFSSLRGFVLGPVVPVAATDTISLDEVRLVTLPPTATACPEFTRTTVSSAGGDVLVPIVLSNPGATPRSYRAFFSSMLGVDRQALEIAVHDIGDTQPANTLQAAVGGEGGLGAVELFAADAAGKPTGSSIVAMGGDGIAVPAGGAWRGLVVHHVRAEMLGRQERVMLGAVTYAVRRDTLTTSVIFWPIDQVGAYFVSILSLTP